MASEAPPGGISAEDWAATPAAVHALVLTLLGRLARVEERLKQTSRNSSKPPSSDPPTLTRPVRSPAGWKTGGRPGHPCGYEGGELAVLSMSRPSRGHDGGRVVPTLSRLYSKPSFHILQSPPPPCTPGRGWEGKKRGRGGIGESEYSQNVFISIGKSHLATVPQSTT